MILGQKDPVAYNLEQALEEGSCPVCRCLAAATTRYLANLLYEFVNDPKTRDHLRAAGGFCREHSWALQQMGDPLAHSIIYADLIEGYLAALQQTGGILRRGSTSSVPEHERRCPVCREEEETENRYVTGLLAVLRDKAFREKYQTAGGLCLPHFQAVYDQARDGKIQAFLTQVQSERLSQLSSELKEFIRKSDYRFADELPGTERDAWIRAVRFWVGPLDNKKRTAPVI